MVVIFFLYSGGKRNCWFLLLVYEGKIKPSNKIFSFYCRWRKKIFFVLGKFEQRLLLHHNVDNLLNWFYSAELHIYHTMETKVLDVTVECNFNTQNCTPISKLSLSSGFLRTNSSISIIVLKCAVEQSDGPRRYKWCYLF